ncbi:DUF1559 family PulG-like putative transporter [Aeoliella sp. SH292]|uniref:DUF1559 family PulG-like putative transporter n=1 Tax=Aeoliella sp. SH292 TaxID=3454464 RepID=UPI003F97806A
MTFRLTTLLYLFALVAASLAAFGGGLGVTVVCGVIAFWSAAFYLPRPGCLTLFWTAAILLILAALLWPAVSTPREASRRNQCLNNMKQLLLAIQNYHEQVSELPPVAGVGKRGSAPQSWRVHILPFSEGSTIHSHYDYNEPWDGPHNDRNFGMMDWHQFECPEHYAPTETNYFAITGPETAWGDGELRTYKDITDGTSNTILLIEADSRGVHWAEPKDLTFQEAVDLLSTPLPDTATDGHPVIRGYFYKPSFVRNVAMCDGSARALRVPIRREDAIALLTASGADSIDFDLIERHSTPQLDYARVWVFSVFVVLALLPAVPGLRPWIWPTRAAGRQLAEDGGMPDTNFPEKTDSQNTHKTDS